MLVFRSYSRLSLQNLEVFRAHFRHHFGLDCGQPFPLFSVSNLNFEIHHHQVALLHKCGVLRVVTVIERAHTIHEARLIILHVHLDPQLNLLVDVVAAKQEVDDT